MPLPQMWVAMSAMETAYSPSDGKIDFPENAAARAERKAGDVRELRARSRAERPPARPRIRLADRLHGDGARRDDVLLDERRRHLQRRRDVVEAFGDVVRRQQARRVDLHREEIANRVRVFLAVEPVQDHLIRQMRRRGRCRAVERVFEPRDERVDGRGVGLPRAGRRHDAAAQLAHGLLEHVGVLADALRRESVEADAGALHAIVMTPGAVLLDRRELLGGFLVVPPPAGLKAAAAPRPRNPRECTRRQQ